MYKTLYISIYFYDELVVGRQPLTIVITEDIIPYVEDFVKDQVERVHNLIYNKDFIKYSINLI